MNAAPASVSPAAERTPIDPIVVKQAATGDEEAFTTLVRRYHPRFVRFARHMLHDDAEADDVVQDAFIRVYRALPQYREQERFESWLFRILANCCRTALAKNRRHNLRLVGLETDAAQEIHHRADGRGDMAWRTLLDAAVEELSAEQREAFLLHHIEGCSYDAMSEITGVRRSALKMRVKRACDQLRAFLGDTSDA
jgi:RNA polymerase sigma-70 factor (ECF subfamily)